MSPPDAPFDVTTHNVKDRELTVAWEASPHPSLLVAPLEPPVVALVLAGAP